MSEILAEKFIYDHLEIALKVIRKFKGEDGEELYSLALMKLHELSKVDLSNIESPRGYIRQSIYYTLLNYCRSERQRRARILHMGDRDPGYTPVEKDFDPPQTELPPEEPAPEYNPVIHQSAPKPKIKKKEYQNCEIVFRDVDVIEFVLSLYEWDDKQEKVIRDFHIRRQTQYAIAKDIGGRARIPFVRRTLRRFEYLVRATQKF